MRRNGVHNCVVWQESQVADVEGWRCDLPPARTPLWQFEQSAVRRAWSIRAGFQVVVAWQSPQTSDDGTCLAGFDVARTERRNVPWQPSQPTGVPLNTAPTWQVSQATLAWPPVRAKAVVA